jgi:hypothetical protein
MRETENTRPQPWLDPHPMLRTRLRTTAPRFRLHPSPRPSGCPLGAQTPVISRGKPGNSRVIPTPRESGVAGEISA